MCRTLPSHPGDGRFVIGIHEWSDAMRTHSPRKQARRVVYLDFRHLHRCEIRCCLALALQHYLSQRR